MECDVLVIGGGPAGDRRRAAGRARPRGRAGREGPHPRFHIGESLLPANVPLFEKLGRARADRAIGMPKWGVEFVSPWHEHSRASRIRRRLGQVDALRLAGAPLRARRDAVPQRAAQRRARASKAAACATCDSTPTAPTSCARDGRRRARRWRARYVIDASGRDTFLASQFGTKRQNPRTTAPRCSATSRRARGCEGKLEGNISIFWFDHGWFWFIPLKDSTRRAPRASRPSSRSRPQGGSQLLDLAARRLDLPRARAHQAPVGSVVMLGSNAINCYSTGQWKATDVNGV